MKNAAWNALVKCQMTVADTIANGAGLPEAKREIGRMLHAQPNSVRRSMSLQSLDRFLTAIPAVTMRGHALVYEIGREIDRRAKLVQRRELRTRFSSASIVG